MTGVIIASVVLVVVVVVLSLMTINKGYGYKHSIDPLPEDDEDKRENG